MMFSADFLDSAHKRAFGNRAEIVESQFCGCFSCFAKFPSSEVWEWIHQGLDTEETGFCPYCMLDTAIGDASGFPVQNQEFLRAMNERFFGEPPFHDQIKDPKAISKPGDWKQVAPETWVLERQSRKSRNA